MHIDLYFLPGMTGEIHLVDKTLVLIDILRASTSICQALQAGASSVIPVEEPGEAAQLREQLGSQNALLAGERKGFKIDGFDLGNSPREFTADMVKDRIIVMTTTNGTRLYARAAKSPLAVTGAFVNIAAVVDRVAAEARDLVILCAGTEGDFSPEDTLCGGMLIDRLEHRLGSKPTCNDAAVLARLFYDHNRDKLSEAVANGAHGRYLIEHGMGEDVVFAAKTDTIPVAPILNDHRIILENKAEV